MHRHLNRGATRGDDPVAHTFGQFKVVAVAGGQIATRLRNRNDRLARLQFLACQPVVQITFQIQRRHFGVVFVHEPLTRTQVFGADFLQRNILTKMSLFAGTLGPSAQIDYSRGR